VAEVFRNDAALVEEGKLSQLKGNAVLLMFASYRRKPVSSCAKRK
jgi:hypothetical protein